MRNSGRRRTAFRALETPSPAASCRPCVLPPLSEASVRRQRRPVGEDHQRLWDIVANKMKVCQIWPPWTHVSPTRGWGCGLQDPSQESRCPMYNTPTTRRIEVTARSVEDRFDLRHRSVAVSGPAGSVLPPNQTVAQRFRQTPGTRGVPRSTPTTPHSGHHKARRCHRIVGTKIVVPVSLAPPRQADVDHRRSSALWTPVCPKSLPFHSSGSRRSIASA